MDSFINTTGSFFNALFGWLLPDFLKVLLIIILSFLLKNSIDFACDKFVEKTGNNKRLLTIRQITHSISSSIITTIALIMILHQLGFDTTPLIAGAGVLGVSFGLGLQHPMKDLINGFFIILEDQFVVGDKVIIGDVSGIVEKVSLRSTTIKDNDGNLHILSNGNIEKITIVKNKKG